jgi:membrane protein implicated in regulation of membrane protease activity
MPVTIDSLIGKKVKIKKALNSNSFIYLVHLEGELWHAISSTPLQKGDFAIIKEIHGLYLSIIPLTPR